MMKFDIGKVVATARVDAKIKEDEVFHRFVSLALGRYINGDWGSTCEEDAAQNEEALKTGESRIFAVYKSKQYEDWTIWIITERDRSVTTILFPEDY